jgi:hypothetical protein
MIEIEYGSRGGKKIDPLLPYRPPNPLSDTFANALNRLQFSAGRCYDDLHTSKCIKHPDGSFAASDQRCS